MRMVRLTGAVVCLAAISLAAQGQANNARLPETMKKLDATSARFKSAQADFHNVLTEVILGEKTETPQDGMIYVEGKGSGTEMGLTLIGQGARTLSYRGGVLKLFNPSAGCYNVVPSKSGQAESFLSLGFGGSGEDLQREWLVTDLGEEMLMSDGKAVPVEKLGLVPKAQSVKNNFSNVTLWMDLTRGIALKQYLLEPSGGSRTAVYSKVRLNASVNKKPFEFKENVCKSPTDPHQR